MDEIDLFPLHLEFERLDQVADLLGPKRDWIGELLMTWDRDIAEKVPLPGQFVLWFAPGFVFAVDGDSYLPGCLEVSIWMRVPPGHPEEREGFRGIDFCAKCLRWEPIMTLGPEDTTSTRCYQQDVPVGTP